MKRKIIVIFTLLVVLACVTALICIMTACNAKNGINVEDESGMKNTNSPENTFRQATKEDIEQTKQEIMQILNDNYEVFCQIVNYFEKGKNDYGCFIEYGEIIIINSSVAGHPHVDISKIEVGEQIAYVLNDLGFVYLGDDINWVVFKKQDGIPPDGGSYTQSLECNKSDADEEKKIREGSSYSAETVHIRDEWYYCYRSMNEGGLGTSQP
jgi:hypothetical protein